jgi:lysophospholipase L1-like esterase
MKKITLILSIIILLTGLSLQNKNKIKVACVGDSITYGSGIKGRDSLSYPAQMQRMIGEGYIVKNFGCSGATLLKKGNKPYWEMPEYQAALTFKPEVVVIKLGTNDSKPYNWAYKEEFKKNYMELIDSFIELGTVKKIFICKPIIVVEDRWDISKEVVEGEIQKIIEEIAIENGVELIDLFTPFKGKDYLLPDKIHPNVEGAKLMAEIIAAKIREYRKSK